MGDFLWSQTEWTARTMTISRLYSNAASATSLWEFMWWEHQSFSHCATRRVQIVETTIPLLLLLLVLLLVLC